MPGGRSSAARGTTASQAHRILQQKAADYRKPEWRDDPQTATEHQAAGLLDEPDADDDLGELTPTQLQSSALLASLPADVPDEAES